MLLKELERSGKADDTLVIFTTDHGFQLSRGKTAMYEGGLRVPSLMRWPGHIEPGLVRDQLVSHVDILSTVMEAVGQPEPANVVGQSLLTLIKDPGIAWRSRLYAEWVSGGPTIYFPQRSIRDERYKLITTLLQDRPSPCARSYSGPEQHWIPGATVEEIAETTPEIRRAYETFANPPPEELYDLENDPWEFNNLVDNPNCQEIRNRLRSELASWQLETLFPDRNVLRN